MSLSSIEASPSIDSGGLGRGGRTVGADRCTHCRLPIPPARSRWAIEGFCCSGCAAAYRLITGAGLGAYYDFADERRLMPALDGGSRAKYQWFDDPDFLSMYVRQLGEDHLAVRLALPGIHCAGCVWLLEKLPQLIPGVIVAQVSWSQSTLDLEWKPERISLSQIAATLAELGYAPYPLSEPSANRAVKHESREQLIRLAVAGAAAGNNMLIAAALYLGSYSGMAASTEQLLRLASGTIGVISLLLPGRVFLTGAWAALRTWTPHMDLPLALGLFVGTIGSLINAVRGTGDIYFDSISVLIFVLLLGRQLQARQQRSAADAIDLQNRLTPKWARRRSGDSLVEVPRSLLRVGDRVQVRPGEIIPVDGTLIDGNGWVNEAVLTGESSPVIKASGDSLAAGTQNLQSTLEIRATAVGNQTRIGRIAELVESAALRKTKIVQWADRIGGRFVIAVIAIAVLTLVYWLRVEPDKAVDRTVALLIVACPCALAMATPLAIAVALARAARHKILIKGGDVLQWLSGTGLIWLDKTGTLTSGQMRLTHWFGDRSAQEAVAAIEALSAHPIAVALSRDLTCGAPERPDMVTLRSTELEPSQSLCGLSAEQSERGGIQAVRNRIEWHIGNRRFVAAARVHGIERFASDEAELLSAGITPVFIAADREMVALAGVGDPIRDDARWSIDQLRSLGWKVGILSGDHRDVVNRVARELAIPPELVRSELLPDEKLAIVEAIPSAHPRERSSRPTVVMIGDGVNDSAALAAAEVGIAVRRGAEASLAAAPVYLAQEGLRGLIQLVRLSRATMRTIRWNAVASLGYNVLAIGLAASGHIGPLLAAILMPLSSLTVVSISLLMPRDWCRGERP